MYEAYSDYESMMNMAEEIVTRCAMATHGKLKVDYQVISLYHALFCLELCENACFITEKSCHDLLLISQFSILPRNLFCAIPPIYC
jgi:lysyl-tRNA synthetase class II